MEIYITGDLHGDLRRFQPGVFYEQESQVVPMVISQRSQ